MPGRGNRTTYKGNALTFDAENRMTAYGSAMTAGYRADNLRAWKQSSPGRFYYYYIGGNPYLETNASGVPQVAHIFAPDGLVARGLGSSWVSFDFDPQGNVLHRYAVNGTIFTTSTNTAYGAFASWGTGTAPWGYNAKWGYYYDWETGFYYCQNRYYDPAVGRWLTRDPIGFAGGMNVYGYAGGSPVGAADPNGLDIIIVVGSQGGSGPKDDADIRKYTHHIMDGIISNAGTEPVHITTSVNDAYLMAKDGDRLYYIGHSDDQGLYMDDGETLVPDGFGDRKLRRIDLIGCQTLSNQTGSAKWAKLSKGNLYGSYGKLQINYYSWGLVRLTKYDGRRRQMPWWGKLFPKGKKRHH